MEEEQAAEAVLDDIGAGLKHAFSPREGGGSPQILDASLTNGSAVAVEWVYDCTQTGNFQGLKPNGRELSIRGLTIVDDNGGTPRFRRYVDWSEVMAQLGMYANFRPTIETQGAGLEGYPDD